MQTSTPSAPPDAPLLEVSVLAGSRGERRLFQNLDFHLRAGQVMWLRGRNGRGKTTLLRLLAGLSTPAQGEIRVLGQSLKSAPASLRSSVGYLAHANALKDDLTAAEALSFVGALSGHTPSPAEVVDALKRLGIASRAGAPVRTLSQGQRRRVALARLAARRTLRCAGRSGCGGAQPSARRPRRGRWRGAADQPPVLEPARSRTAGPASGQLLGAGLRNGR
jgi:heme exporter protein A